METSHDLVLRRLVSERDGAWPERLTVDTRALPGGLEAAAVLELVARYRDRTGRARQLRVVSKRLEGAAAREGSVYEQLVRPHAAAIAPELYWVDRPAQGQAVLFLERVSPSRRWPWRDLRSVAEVLAALAALHRSAAARHAVAALPGWDYEPQQAAAAVATLEFLRALRGSELTELTRAMAPLERLVLALPRIRRQLLEAREPAAGALHGDVHSGNAFMRRRDGREVPVLLDWGRARRGSPFEDVGSWLQSLGLWEAEARRRHDTLLTGYLAAHGLAARLSSNQRALYWLACASNTLAGALLYHLSVAADPARRPADRAKAVHAARDGLRVIRRADAAWR